MQDFTVIGYYDENGQIFSDFVQAENAMQAFAISAQQRNDALFVAAFEGKHQEGESASFPGEGVVDGESILAQTDVFS